MQFPCMKMKIFMDENPMHEIVYSPISHENFLVEKIIPVAKLSVPCIKRSCHDFFIHETFRTDVN